MTEKNEKLKMMKTASNTNIIPLPRRTPRCPEIIVLYVLSDNSVVLSKPESDFFKIVTLYCDLAPYKHISKVIDGVKIISHMCGPLTWMTVQTGTARCIG